MVDNRVTFGSKLGVILATVGCAVGLGSIWRFPYMLGTNGGAAFLLIYILFMIFLGILVMVTEFFIGRCLFSVFICYPFAATRAAHTSCPDSPGQMFAALRANKFDLHYFACFALFHGYCFAPFICTLWFIILYCAELCRHFYQ